MCCCSSTANKLKQLKCREYVARPSLHSFLSFIFQQTLPVAFPSAFLHSSRPLFLAEETNAGSFSQTILLLSISLNSYLIRRFVFADFLHSGNIQQNACNYAHLNAVICASITHPYTCQLFAVRPFERRRPQFRPFAALRSLLQVLLVIFLFFFRRQRIEVFFWFVFNLISMRTRNFHPNAAFSLCKNVNKRKTAAPMSGEKVAARAVHAWREKKHWTKLRMNGRKTEKFKVNKCEHGSI